MMLSVPVLKPQEVVRAFEKQDGKLYVKRAVILS